MLAAASPPPAPHSTAGRPYPTYTQMITQALTELGGGAAASRAAIASYILDCYSGLPVSHNALLSAHLRRLVAEGFLRTDGPDSSSYLFAPPPPTKDSDASVTPAVGEKRGRGRPRKSPHGSSELSTHTGASVLPAKRKQPAGSVLTEDGDPVTKRGPRRPSKDKTPVQAGCEATAPLQEALGGKKARIFQNEGDATPVPSGGSSSTRVKRGHGRPRKEKPSEPAATSPAAGSVAAASMRFKRGCGRPSMQKPWAAARSPEAISAETSMEKVAAAAAMYAGTRGADDAASTGTKPGGGPLTMEKLAAAVEEAMSAKKGREKEDLAAPAGVKRSRGRPRKDQCRTGLVEPADEALGDMMAEPSTRRKEEDLVLGEKTQTECVAPRGRKETTAADAGCVPVFGENAPVGAADSDLGPADLADGVVSTGVKRGRGRPRKNKPAAAMPAETGEARHRPTKNKPAAAAIPAEAGDAASAGIEAGGGTPTVENSSEAARSLEAGDATSTGIKRSRGRPRKYPAAAMSSKTRDAASAKVKRGRGRPRKKKLAPPAQGKSRGRPRKDQFLYQCAGEAFFTRGVAQATKERVAGAGRVSASGENAVLESA